MEIGFTTVDWLLTLVIFSPFIKVLSCLTVLRYGLGAGRSGFGIIITVIALTVALSHPWNGPAPRFRTENSTPTLTLNQSDAKIKSQIEAGISNRLAEIPTSAGLTDDGRLATGFVLTNLKNGIELGVALTLPLIVVDLLAVHLLQLLGITQLSLSLLLVPIKLLLFTSIGGWELLVAKLLSGD